MEVLIIKKRFFKCESGGTLEFHIEPVLPMTKLIIYGNTPTAYAIANMGHFLNYDCCLCSPDLNPDYKFSIRLRFLIILKHSQLPVAVVAPGRK